LLKKGERRDDRNDDRVEGGGGDRRIDVRRIGRSRFDDTFLISFTLSRKSFHVPLSPPGLEQPRTLPSADAETPPLAVAG
jgi:hypothetical protein